MNTKENCLTTSNFVKEKQTPQMNIDVPQFKHKGLQYGLHSCSNKLSYCSINTKDGINMGGQTLSAKILLWKAMTQDRNVIRDVINVTDVLHSALPRFLSTNMHYIIMIFSDHNAKRLK